MGYLKNIKEWIKFLKKEFIHESDSSFTKDFGYVKMNDGREAQIQVKLEMDEENFL